MNDDVEVQNASSHFCKRVSDTERSNRLMQVTKHVLRGERAPHLNAVRLLVEQTLGCCGGKRKRQRFSTRVQRFPGPEGYANMQQAHQSAALIFKTPGARAGRGIHNATQQMHRMASAFMQSCSPVTFDVPRPR